MKYQFQLQCKVVDENGLSNDTSLTLEVNAEDVDNATKKAQRALQKALLESDPRIFYTHDR